MTERHADRGRDLRQHIDGCHDKDRIEQTLEVGQNAVRFDLVVHDQNKHHDGPRCLGVQVGRGAPQANDTDEVAADAQSEDRADQGDILVKVIPHVVVHELIQPLHDELGRGLPL